jgi:hypothetical protein
VNAQPIDPGREALLRALQDGGVVYVVIGGAALETHDQPYRTDDVDVTPAVDAHNLDRLADVLNGLDCRLVTDVDDPSSWVPLPKDYFTAATLRRADVWNLQTSHGALDVTFRASPTAMKTSSATLSAYQSPGRAWSCPSPPFTMWSTQSAPPIGPRTAITSLASVGCARLRRTARVRPNLSAETPGATPTSGSRRGLSFDATLVPGHPLSLAAEGERVRLWRRSLPVPGR